MTADAMEGVTGTGIATGIAGVTGVATDVAPGAARSPRLSAPGAGDPPSLISSPRA